MAIAGSLDDDLVACVGQPVKGAVAEDEVVEQALPLLHVPFGGDDETGDPVTADCELVEDSWLLGCEPVKDQVI